MTDDNLPPLPRPAHIKVHTDSQGFQYWDEPFYSADQVEEIRRAAILAERERCAKVCEDIGLKYWALWKKRYNPDDQGKSNGADECAAAIREGRN